MAKSTIENGERSIDLEFRAIGSLFETGSITKMYEISKLYPTKVVKALGLNYGRYIEKLSKPENFSMSELLRFAFLIGVEPTKVIEIVLREAIPNVDKKTKHTQPSKTKKVLINPKTASNKKKS